MMGQEDGGLYYRTLARAICLFLCRETSVPTTRRTAASASSRVAATVSPRRKFVVFVSLVGALTLTSALLLALAPESLKPDAARSLFASGAPQTLDVVFETTEPIREGRWRYVFIHQSRTGSGDALSLAQTPDGAPDHFVIGNGNGCQDGEIQVTQRWTQQDVPGDIPGLPRTQPNFISICLVGDFDLARPTPAQQNRLVQLVNALQRRLDIPRANVTWFPGGAGIAGVGRSFPAADLHAQLIP
jgi:hypothetical protein